LPGTKNGEPVSMETEVSLAFKIKPTSDFVEMAQWNMNKGNELCFEKNQPKRALKYFNQAFNYLPNHDAITSVRGLCKYLMGDLDGAGKDWERANILAQRNGENVDKEQVAIDASSINKARQLMLYVKK
jgi:Tfp pilus assembly protein PilF